MPSGPDSKHFTHSTGWSLFQCDSYPVGECKDPGPQRGDYMKAQEKAAIRAKRKDLRETSPANSIILDSSLQKEGEMNASFYEPSGLWYLVMADKADQSSS